MNSKLKAVATASFVKKSMNTESVMFKPKMVIGKKLKKYDVGAIFATQGTDQKVATSIINGEPEDILEFTSRIHKDIHAMKDEYTQIVVDDINNMLSIAGKNKQFKDFNDITNFIREKRDNGIKSSISPLTLVVKVVYQHFVPKDQNLLNVDLEKYHERDMYYSSNQQVAEIQIPVTDSINDNEVQVILDKVRLILNNLNSTDEIEEENITEYINNVIPEERQQKLIEDKREIKQAENASDEVQPDYDLIMESLNESNNLADAWKNKEVLE